MPVSMVAPNDAYGARYTSTARQGHAKHDPERGIDEETLEVRTVEVTSCNVGDAPMLPEFLNQISPEQDIGSATADEAYDTRKCHEAIAARDAHAVIPPRKNAQPWKPTSAGAIARNDAASAQRYLGRTLWRRWSGYHRRSHVETTLWGHCYAIPCRAVDALYKTTRPVADGEGLRKAGRRDPGSYLRPQPLHCSWHTSHRVCRLNPSGVTGRTSFNRLVQQSHVRG